MTYANRRAALAFIFVVVLLDVLAMGVVIPVLPKLIVQFENGDTVRAAQIYGIFGTAWSLMQFIFSPILGVLSDRFGRRPVILLSNLGLGLDYVLMALAPDLGWLFVGRVISGITAASWTTAGAYIADITPPDQRAASFGIVGSAFGLGFVLGPAFGGLLGGFDPRLPFWVAGILSLASVAYGVFILPESLTIDRRSPLSWSRVNPIASMAIISRHSEILGLASARFLTDLAHHVFTSVFVLYTGYRYGWSEQAVGLTLALVGVCAMIVQGGLVRPIVQFLGERQALALGLLFGTVGFMIYGWAPTGALFLIGVPVMSFWGVCGPAAQSIMTRKIASNEQGQLQGALSAMTGIAGLIGPGLFAMTFAQSIGPWKDWASPGMPFYLSGLLLGLAIVLAWRATKPTGTS